MYLTYPAIFYKGEQDGFFTAEVPDLPGCVSGGATLAEAILMITDAASGWVLDELEDGNVAPSASPPASLSPEGNGFVNLIVLDMDAYAEKYGKNAVRKNCTIPAYLNTFAEKNNINFSKVLQEALGEIYHSSH